MTEGLADDFGDLMKMGMAFDFDKIAEAAGFKGETAPLGAPRTPAPRVAHRQTLRRRTPCVARAHRAVRRRHE